MRVNPEKFGSFQEDDQRMFEEVEQALRIHLVFKPDENLPHEQFDVMAV